MSYVHNPETWRAAAEAAQPAMEALEAARAVELKARKALTLARRRTTQAENAYLRAWQSALPTESAPALPTEDECPVNCGQATCLHFALNDTEES